MEWNPWPKAKRNIGLVNLDHVVKVSSDRFLNLLLSVL
jgi:hypothetical protein